jgi:cytochrome c oxidase assembly protein subunit 11
MSHRNRNTALLMAVLGVAMLALSFGSVPLYRIFCQQTGYGGTPHLANEGSKRVGQKLITVRYSATVHRDIPWAFKPLQLETTVRVGETGLAFYHVKNLSNIPFVGIATYSVTPTKAAMYFNKIRCFCFEDQHFGPNEQQDMPVQFFIDPAIEEDPNCQDVTTITLSYTFFHAKDPNIPAILGLPSATYPTRRRQKGP